MSQDVTLPSLLSTSNGVHYLSFCLNHLQYLFICFVLSPCYFHHSPPCQYFKCLKSPNIFFCPRFASIQRNTPNKCFHHTFLQMKAEGSSHEVIFLVESLFSQSNSFSYITRLILSKANQSKTILGQIKCAVLTVFWLFLTIGVLIVTGLAWLYQQCTNSVPIVKNSQKS